VAISLLFSASFALSRASGLGADDGRIKFFANVIILRDLFFRSLNVVILSQLRAKSVKGECGALDS